ncbi:MAG: Ppx/GppA family phosphatase [Deltaproteobacteria bacterium]|nr:Ppx/GppA family phosphatase [Deltaproteobacteria bacterium]
MKLAAIDIGTHSVLLLITTVKNGKALPLADEATLTRIGEGMGKRDQGPRTTDHGPESPNVFLTSAMERTLAVLKRYKDICNRLGVEKILAVGTAAFRKAQNAQDFIQRVEKECRIRIKIICPEREAELTWKAASTDFGENILVVDIGGGSTEVMTGPGTPSTSSGQARDQGLRTVSIPIGSILLTEQYCRSDPISEADDRALGKAIDEQISSLDIQTYRHKHVQTLVATAGTATTLGAIKKRMKVYQHNEIHGSMLSVIELKKIIADFKSKTIAERKKIPGLEPGRADVILAGSLLLQKIAGRFGFEEITISDRGVRWGLTYETFQTA